MKRPGLFFDLTVALIGFGLFFSRFQFPFILALLAGLAMAAASFATRQTAGKLLQLYRSSGGEVEGSGPSGSERGS